MSKQELKGKATFRRVCPTKLITFIFHWHKYFDRYDIIDIY
jgi:hypothetical protein